MWPETGTLHTTEVSTFMSLSMSMPVFLKALLVLDTFFQETQSTAYVDYRKRLSDTWWLLSMRLRTRLGHRQYLLLCKAHRRSIEIRASQIVGC